MRRMARDYSLHIVKVANNSSEIDRQLSTFKPVKPGNEE